MEWGANKGADVAEEVFVEEMEEDEGEVVERVDEDEGGVEEEGESEEEEESLLLEGWELSSTDSGSQWIFKPWGVQSSCATWCSAAFARRVSEAKSHELPSGAMRWSVVTPKVG